MNEEITNAVPAPEPVTTQTPAQDRIKQLSDKVELTSKERDEMKTLNEVVTRERDFYKGFSDVVSTNPMAKDHQDAIKEKVLKGYSVQDATYAVLGAEGKLGAQTPVAPASPAGGSASTAMPQGGEKDPKDMTQAERREILEKILIRT